ncbi:YqcC family protein [Halopseudomonas sp.]|uniref:YqcC family protein n=1 Tax=Halopseudomonas sp. TaxID=2901191 RepID=UPI00311EFFCA
MSVAWSAMADALLELEMELRQLQLWSQQAPERWQLESEAPFCVDTLAFEQWLQWVFIPQLIGLLERGETLPGECRIEPMGEEAFAHLGRRRGGLLAALGKVDRCAAMLAAAPA